MSRCTIESAPGGYRVQTPYDPAFVAALKAAVPHAERQWQKPHWIVSAARGSDIVALVETFFDERLTLPRAQATSAIETRAIEVRYLGRCKDRGNGDVSAYGYADGSWSVAIPEKVLRAWFCDEAPPSEPAEAPSAPAPQTLYAVLGLKKTADEQAIKQAYRRLARQWHPDVCREADAKERFIGIQAAYEVLSDPLKRRKYHAGLELSASFEQRQKRAEAYARRRAEELAQEYRAPLRCGHILAEGQQQLGRFVVSKIIGWNDIVNAAGKTLVVSWPADADTFEEAWV